MDIDPKSEMPGLVPEQIPIAIDAETFLPYFLEQDWNNLAEYLNAVFKLPTSSSGRHKSLLVTESTVGFLVKLIEQVAIVCRIPENKNIDEVKYIAKTVFRCLRNAVALSSSNQNLICHNNDLIVSSFDIVDNFISSDDPEHRAITETWMQFLVNIVVNNVDTGKKIWYTFFDYRARYALETYPKYQYYTCALLYNILRNDEEKDGTMEEDIFTMFVTILNSDVDHSNNEYLNFLIEYFLNTNIFALKYYLVQSKELKILDVLRELLWNDCDKDKDICSQTFLEMLIVKFNEDSNCILKTASYVETIEPLVVSMISDILAAISCYEKYLPVLQANKCLFVSCVFLLKGIHCIGSRGQNMFTPMEKLSDFKTLENVDTSHPVYGFKANMIRIIGNMCWNNKHYQEEVNDLECIPLLLDCCKMDAKNPFMIQWVVLAIRNICKNNLANQSVIAAMKKEGVVDNATLKELGISTQKDNLIEDNTLEINRRLNLLNISKKETSEKI